MPPVVSEDVLARLRQAEEEAARLKKELAAAQAAVRQGNTVAAIACTGPLLAGACAAGTAACCVKTGNASGHAAHLKLSVLFDTCTAGKRSRAGGGC